MDSAGTSTGLRRMLASVRTDSGAGALRSAIDGGVTWLAGSGICSPAHPIYAWYDRTAARYSFPYSEATGYGITFFVFLSRQGGDARYLSKANDLARSLQTMREPLTGAYRCLDPVGMEPFDQKARSAYIFDCCMILNGLCQLYRETRDDECFRHALRCAEWIMQGSDRAADILPVYDVDTARFAESPGRWSTSRSGYRAKFGLAFLNVFDLTGDERFLRAAQTVCQAATRMQSEAGGISVFENGELAVLAHPHCYAAEGLWAAGTYLGRQDYLEASARATKWILEQYRQLILRREERTVEVCDASRTDALAQALRLYALHRQSAMLDTTLQDVADTLICEISARQCAKGDALARGGFHYDGSPAPGAAHVNAWVTMFAVQAFWLMLESQRGSTLSPFDLV